MEKKLPETLGEIWNTWQGEGPIRLMFQDEARFGRITDTRRCWCPKPHRPMCSVLVSQEYTYAYAGVFVDNGEMDSLILPNVNTKCMQAFVNEVGERHPNERIVMVLDGAGWHRSKELKIPSNVRFLPLPAYSPELNPVENIWEEIREKYFSNKVFDSLDSLEDHLTIALGEMEQDHERVHSIVAWAWILNALLN